MNRKYILSIFMLAFMVSNAMAENVELGKIVLNPYVFEASTPDEERANKVLLHRLNGIVNNSGMTGSGIDDRFIITAHSTELETVTTSTAPVKYVMNLMVTIYVGDATDGTLFSQWSTELKAVGSSRGDCLANAYRKINVNDRNLLAAIEQGKQRIIDYYNQFGPKIIAKARADAQAGNYDEAVSRLMAVPSVCKDYDTAMKLAGQYGFDALEKYNLNLITTARAQWSANPTEYGAAQAQETLARLETPSANAVAQAQKLTREMANRLQNVEDCIHALAEKQVEYQHQETMRRINAGEKVAVATVNAASRAAVAYYKSRPRTVYHVHWW